MNWEAIGAIGEVVGAVAVVATLLYLSTQLRQNTRAAHNSSWQAIVQLLSNLDVTEATDPSLSEFIRRAESSADGLSDDEMWKFYRVAQARLGVIEYAFLASQSGTIDQFYWDGILPYVEVLASKPGYAEFWVQQGRDIYHPDFVHYFDTVLRACSADSN